MGTPEHDFAQFRATGSATALAAVFDALAPELLLVAAHLAPRGVDAEDIVQTTFLHAIRRAARWDATRPLLPWLIGILVRNAQAEGRSRGRQPDPARLPPRVGEPTPPQASEAQELAEQVAGALRELPVPYRQVLSLRLVHGLSAVEIAHTLACPLATVKTRLQRGLDRLREALPAGLASSAVALLAGRGLAAARQAVLEAVGAGAAVSSVAAATVSSVASATVGTGVAGVGWVGGVLMKKLLVVAGAGLVASVTWLAWPTVVLPPPSSMAPADAARVLAAASHPATPPPDNAPIAPERIAIAAQAGSTTGQPAASPVDGRDRILNAEMIAAALVAARDLLSSGDLARAMVAARATCDSVPVDLATAEALSEVCARWVAAALYHEERERVATKSPELPRGRAHAGQDRIRFSRHAAISMAPDLPHLIRSAHVKVTARRIGAQSGKSPLAHATSVWEEGGIRLGAQHAIWLVTLGVRAEDMAAPLRKEFDRHSASLFGPRNPTLSPRPSPEVQQAEPPVTGSADTTGSVTRNDRLLPDRRLTARELLQKPFVDVAAEDLPPDAVTEALVAAGAVSPEDAERMWAIMVRGVAAFRWETEQSGTRRATGDAAKDALARADQELRLLVSGLVRDLPKLIRDGKTQARGFARGPAVPPTRVLGNLGCDFVASDRLRFQFVDPPCSLHIEISAEDLTVTQRSIVHAIAGELLPGGRPAIR